MAERAEHGRWRPATPDAPIVYLPSARIGRGGVVAPSLQGAVPAAVASLRRYARALIQDPVVADLRCEDALAFAGRHVRRAAGRDLRIWLFRIFHGRLRRSLDRRPVHEDRPEADVRREVRDMRRALRALPPDQRAVLLLVTLEGFGYGEVGEILDLPPALVCGKLTRARENLRLYLEDARPSLRRVK